MYQNCCNNSFEDVQKLLWLRLPSPFTRVSKIIFNAEFGRAKKYLGKCFSFAFFPNFSHSLRNFLLKIVISSPEVFSLKPNFFPV